MTAVPDRRRAQIIEAARAIIERDGTTKLTAAAVAKGVGVSRPLLYHYFADMDELVEEVVSQYVDEFEACFEQWYACHRDDALEDGLPSCAEFMRRELVATCPRGIDDPSLGLDGRTRTTYLARCSQIVSEGLAGKDGALSGQVRAHVPLPEKTMRVLMLGLAQYQQTRTDVAADELGEIVRRGFGFGPARATDAPAAETGVPTPAQDDAPTRRRGILGRIFSS